MTKVSGNSAVFKGPGKNEVLPLKPGVEIRTAAAGLSAPNDATHFDGHNGSEQERDESKAGGKIPEAAG